MNERDLEIVRRIERNDESALKEIYFSLSKSFLSFFQRYGLNKAELEDVFQDSIIALYQNIIQRKFTNMEASIKSYVWAIGKFKIIDVLRKKKVRRDTVLPDDHITPIDSEGQTLSAKQNLLQLHFRSLGKSCQNLIKLFYYEGLTISEIVKIGAYKDENTVKSSKSRCIKQLRSLIKAR